MTTLRFFVAGNPAPQGSKNISRTGRPYEASKRLKPWRETIVRVAQNATEADGWEQPSDGVHVRAIFWLARPKSVNIRRRPRPTVTPDIDKLLRALFDSLKLARIVHDDAEIVTTTVAKAYCDNGQMPGVQVTVCEPPEMA